MRQKFLLGIAFLACCCAVTFGVIQIDPKTSHFVDENGRVLLFHGVNAVYKVAPYLPLTDTFDPQLSLSEEDCANLKNWGFNAIRLGVMWPGVEPQSLQYNQTYLAQARALVDKLGSYGIYTIVDLHQDLWSPFFCGEGVPDFIVKASSTPFSAFPGPFLSKLPLDEHGYPLLDACLKNPFFKYYFSAAVASGFQSLYDNFGGVQDSLVGFWTQVAHTFADSESVLGYELLNEPWAGNIYSDPLLLVEPGLADRRNLVPLYTRLHNAIRAVDDKHIIFFEPAVSDIFESGFKEGPGGPSYNDRQAYSYHVYCPLLDAHGDPRTQPVCDVDVIGTLDMRMADCKRMGVAGFMTEFGADSNATVGAAGIAEAAVEADNRFQSWAYWQFKQYLDPTTSNPDRSEGFYMPDGILEIDKVRALSRAYPRRTAGTPVLFTFNANTSALHYEYIVNTSITQPTELYLNEEYYYPQGLTVIINPPASLVWSQPSANLINVVPAASTPNGTRVTVIVSRK